MPSIAQTRMDSKPPDLATQTRSAVAFVRASQKVMAEARHVGVRLSFADAQHLVRLAVTEYLTTMAEGGR